jgi:hypothetical protein
VEHEEEGFLPLEAKGRYYRTDGKMHIYIPVILAADSQFPLTGEKGSIKIHVEGKRLVIEKA